MGLTQYQIQSIKDSVLVELEMDEMIDEVNQAIRDRFKRMSASNLVEAIANDLEPDDVFDWNTLKKWAESNGFVLGDNR